MYKIRKNVLLNFSLTSCSWLTFGSWFKPSVTDVGCATKMLLNCSRTGHAWVGTIKELVCRKFCTNIDSEQIVPQVQTISVSAIYSFYDTVPNRSLFIYLFLFSLFHNLLYIICRFCNKCICSISTGSWTSYAHWRNSYFSFVHLDITLILVLGFYSGLSGRVRTVYLSSLCVASLLSSRFNV
jgi:hypothetical protein